MIRHSTGCTAENWDSAVIGTAGVFAWERDRRLCDLERGAYIDGDVSLLKGRYIPSRSLTCLSFPPLLLPRISAPSCLAGDDHGRPRPPPDFPRCRPHLPRCGCDALLHQLPGPIRGSLQFHYCKDPGELPICALRPGLEPQRKGDMKWSERKSLGCGQQSIW